MILGLGSDMVHIDRIEELLSHFGDRFITRSFTKAEIEGSKRFGANNNIGRAGYFARRFAAKEACAKALGTGFRDGLRLTHIGVVNDAMGKPHLELTDKAQELLQGLAPKGGRAIPHLTMCDDYPLAQATVIIAVG